MPTYDYKCPNCGRFEVEQRITESALESCPTCAAPVKRLISRNLSILFKGPGFHVNDYPSSGRRSSDPATGTATPPADTAAATPEAAKTSDSGKAAASE